MSGDIVSLRMVIVSRAASHRGLWRQAAALAPLPVEMIEATSAQEARAAFASEDVDIVLIDSAMPEPDRSAVSGAVRMASPAPFIVAVTSSESAAVGIDADGVVTTPSSLAEAQYLIDRLAHVKLPSKVLIVDDSGTMRSIVRKIFAATRFPVDVAEAGEGEGALESIRRGDFDIVILDYNMPGLNGLDTLAEIKREHPRVEVVMISSTQDDGVATRVRAAGAAAFLKKPFFPADIGLVMHAFCGMRPRPN